MLTFGVEVQPAPDAGEANEYGRHEGKPVVPPSARGGRPHPKPYSSDNHSHGRTYGVNDCKLSLESCIIVDERKSYTLDAQNRNRWGRHC